MLPRLVLLLSGAAFLGSAPTFGQEVGIEPAFPGLNFSLPIGIAPLPGSKDALFVIEKGDPVPGASADKSGDKKKRAGAYLGGKIQMVTGLSTGKPAKRQVFQLAVKDGEFEAGGECGLLGFAVHPDYTKNPQVFVYYSIKLGGKLHQRLSRFQLKPGAAFEVDPASEQPLITQQDPASNHNGGDVHFGPDGYLYFSCGDGGAGGDAFNNAGFINKGFHAGVYRIDIDKKPGNLAPNAHPSVITDAQGAAFYAIPADNPFVRATSHRGQPLEPKTVRTETWATGLRNPWRFSFDPLNGTCFTGDVGQNLFEEIDILVSGGDYGWSEIEGLHVYNRKDASAKQGPAASAPASKQWIAPIYEYDRKVGNSVTGGVVYRGDGLPGLKGAYVFGDYASGRIIALREKDGKWDGQVIAKDMTIAGFGHDPANGDVLFAAMSGQVKRLTKK
jgi:glucose/arabinose dehydrogenase